MKNKKKIIARGKLAFLCDEIKELENTLKAIVKEMQFAMNGENTERLRTLSIEYDEANLKMIDCRKKAKSIIEEWGFSRCQ